MAPSLRPALAFFDDTTAAEPLERVLGGGLARVSAGLRATRTPERRSDELQCSILPESGMSQGGNHLSQKSGGRAVGRFGREDPSATAMVRATG
jgi:hypothetical protein